MYVNFGILNHYLIAFLKNSEIKKWKIKPMVGLEPALPRFGVI